MKTLLSHRQRVPGMHVHVHVHVHVVTTIPPVHVYSVLISNDIVKLLSFGRVPIPHVLSHNDLCTFFIRLVV